MRPLARLAFLVPVSLLALQAFGFFRIQRRCPVCPFERLKPVFLGPYRVFGTHNAPGGPRRGFLPEPVNPLEIRGHSLSEASCPL